MCAEAHHHGLRMRHRLSREVAASGSTGTRRFHPLSAFHLSGFLVLRWQYDKRDEAIKRTRKRLVRPSAGINRHAVGNERVLQERSSEPPGFVSCGVSREAAAEAWARGISGLGIELREDKFGAPTLWTEGEGHTVAGAKSRVRRRLRVVVDPRHAEKLHAREPGDLIVGCQ